MELARDRKSKLPPQGPGGSRKGGGKIDKAALEE